MEVESNQQPPPQDAVVPVVGVCKSVTGTFLKRAFFMLMLLIAGVFLITLIDVTGPWFLRNDYWFGESIVPPEKQCYQSPLLFGTTGPQATFDKKFKFLDSIPNLHPLVKEQWMKFNRSLDDNGKMSKECLQRAVGFVKNEVPDVNGKYYREYSGRSHDPNVVRDIRFMSFRNGRVVWSQGPTNREKDLAQFIETLYSSYPDLPDVDFLEDLNDGALCAPWLTEDCAMPLFVHEAGMECAACLGTGRPTVHPVYLNEPDFGKWEEKKEIGVWRGSTTGGAGWTIVSIKNSTRFKLVDLSLEYPALLDARFTGIVQTDDKELKSYMEETGRLCDTCGIDSKRWPEWKYLVVVDGNSNPDRFPFFLSLGSVVLRQEWIGLEVFEYGLKPFEHYIPVKRDLSDLIEKIEWAKSHDDECKQIAQNAWCFINSTFTHPTNVEYWKGFIRAYSEIVPRL
eukprot:TRINITY_DN7303_c0_g1_i14.p1 TRINITY_DN7303_c0_g1~~TRINITY_DN7303_c0_g1_i14.p1  ORF type:complete len:453 (-),score=97.51 TRINITY_DN7303_c0_g1_i14:471-1829(-)